LSRPGGAISRRAAAAVRIAGISAPASNRRHRDLIDVPALHREPWIMIFTLPPTRGMVSFDAVTSRLPSQFQSMTFGSRHRCARFATAQRPHSR
jgi:hypothetical protein